MEINAVITSRSGTVFINKVRVTSHRRLESTTHHKAPYRLAWAGADTVEIRDPGEGK